MTNEEYLRQQEQKLLDAAKKQKGTYNASFDSAVKAQQQAVEKQSTQLDRDYEDLFQASAVQKEINKRQIAESMANAGLTNSGLDRSQLTAVELAQGNRDRQYSAQLQKSKDSLSQALSDYMAEVTQKKAAYGAEVDANAQSSIAAYRESIQKAQIEAETARQKAAASAAASAAQQTAREQANSMENKTNKASASLFGTRGDTEGFSEFLIQLASEGYSSAYLNQLYDEFQSKRKAPAEQLTRNINPATLGNYGKTAKVQRYVK